MKHHPAASASFTLVEILTATAVLSILFLIMFGMLQQVSTGWQAANRRVEASQAARLAFEQIAQGLENCVVVRRVSQTVPGSAAATNLAYGFAFYDGATNPITSSWVVQTVTLPNDMIFFVTPARSSLRTGGEDLEEIGYVPVWVNRTSAGAPGYGNVRIGRYVLLEHRASAELVQTVGGVRSTNEVPASDFMTNSTNWEQTPGLRYEGTVENFFPIVDNCVGFNVAFHYTNNLGRQTVASWGRPNTNPAAAAGARWDGNPTGVDGLPVSATLTMCVLDERSAERVHRLRPTGLTRPMIAALVAAATNASAFNDIPDDPAGLRATLRAGMIAFQREVFFKTRGL